MRTETEKRGHITHRACGAGALRAPARALMPLGRSQPPGVVSWSAMAHLWPKFNTRSAPFGRPLGGLREPEVALASRPTANGKGRGAGAGPGQGGRAWASTHTDATQASRQRRRGARLDATGIGGLGLGCWLLHHAYFPDRRLCVPLPARLEHRRTAVEPAAVTAVAAIGHDCLSEHGAMHTDTRAVYTAA